MKPVIAVSPNVNLTPAAAEYLKQHSRSTGEPDGLLLRRDDPWLDQIAEQETAARAFAFAHTSVGSHEALEFAEDAGIAIFKLEPSELGGITCTPEHTWGLIHAVHRSFGQPYKAPPKMLSRMWLGILGFGRVGTKVAQIGNNICSSVRVHDLAPARLHQYGPTWDFPSMLGLIQRSDILCICIGARASYDEIISNLAALPKNAILINTAQPSAALDREATRLVRAGHLWGYGTDRPADLGVIDVAQTKYQSNIITTPHIAGSTQDAWAETQLIVIKKMLAFLNEQEKK